MVCEVTLYGIPNCDTIEKARLWFDNRNIEFDFHDYRKQSLDYRQLQTMETVLGWEAMLNRRRNSWRSLPDNVKGKVDAVSAMQLMRDNPAIIKRPMLVKSDQIHPGFSDQQYQEVIS